MIADKKEASICTNDKPSVRNLDPAPHAMSDGLDHITKRQAFPLVGLLFLINPQVQFHKVFSGLSHWRLSRKIKSLITVVIIAVFLISAFAFLPKLNVSRSNFVLQNGGNSFVTPSPQATNHARTSPTKNKSNPDMGNMSEIGESYGPSLAPPIIESNSTINSSVWMNVSGDAWSYYQPGIGVDNNTGLPYADTSFYYFTDWDLGCYIQAVIDAQKLSFIVNVGTWDFSSRIDKVLTFLENRPLNPNTNYPFQFYDATSGQPAPVPQASSVDVSDTGRLFVALNNLINYNSSLRQRIDNIVFNGTSDYAALVPRIKADILSSTSIYSYYVDSGFACFWPDLPNPNIILNNIYAAGNVTTYGDVTLPKASITGDPMLCSIFELGDNNPQLMTLSKQVYLASEAYYNSTGNYVAFSEGNGPGGFIYEWVVLPNGDTWKITGATSNVYLPIAPIIYTKIAFSFLALYNTTYAQNMVVYLEQTLPNPCLTSGYSDGADNNGNWISSVGSDTNSLILDAGLYATQK